MKAALAMVIAIHVGRNASRLLVEARLGDHLFLHRRIETLFLGRQLPHTLGLNNVHSQALMRNLFRFLKMHQNPDGLIPEHRRRPPTACSVVGKAIRGASPFGAGLNTDMKTMKVIVSVASPQGPKPMRQLTLPKPIITMSLLMPSCQSGFKLPSPSLCISFPRAL